jgi:hypothetical protein
MVRSAVRREVDERIVRPHAMDLTGRELVDLWLNAVFAHSGLAGATKLRHRFDTMVDRYGHGAFEFAFRHIVWALGIQHKNLAQPARVLLERWRSEFGATPSFRPGSAFGTKRRERTATGELIIRESSSEYSTAEHYEQRFTRILARSDFASLQTALQLLQFRENELVRLVLKHNTYSSLVGESCFELEILEYAPTTPTSTLGLRLFTTLADESGKLASSLYASENAIVTDTTGVQIIDRVLASFKDELINS